MKLKYSILLVLVLSLVACDPRYGERYFVENKSNYDVLVAYKRHDTDTVITINSLQHALFYENYRIGYAEDMGEYFLTNTFDTLYFTLNDTLKLTKNWQKRETWEYIETGEEEGGVANYTFTIENGDIVKSR